MSAPGKPLASPPPVSAQPGEQPPAHWAARNERGSPWAMRLMLRLSLALGRWPTRPILWLIAAYFVCAARQARHASRDYLSRVLGHRASLWHVFRHFLCFSTTVHDRVFILNDKGDLFDIRLFGEETMHRMNDEHGGLLLFGAHMGSFDALRAAARNLSGRRITMAMYEENARHISQMLASVDPDAANEILPLGRLDSMLQVQERLAAGQIVGILADRSFGKSEMRPTEVLGADAPLPTGAFRMAALLRVPVFFMVSLYRGGNRYDVHFEPLANFTDYSHAEKEALMETARHHYADLLTRFCREAPYNWFNFFEFWNAGEATTTRTRSRQTSEQPS
ncbi:acyl-CoA synthetase [Uliginosibacterium sp. H3]|uniref:Acyl-CoA synthetase n=1 Tax=Uliginosibacterium silvisoli TaxID=3114758 RepID=A0ABU6JY44_9RHOO|nr:acyl-CoA synthetase [Uliginosibacterium sp. H3]